MEKRLDILLVEKGLAASRERAKDLIEKKQVFVSGKPAVKASQKAEEEEQIEIRGETLKYVSRGGLKLEKAMEVFGLELQEKVCLDIGASTGGFTDCMLQNGAAKVFSIDVGRDQLANQLREDPRVVNMEQTNVRYLTLDELIDKGAEGPADFVSIDVSFISLTKILEAIAGLMKTGAQAVCLIKPQFEAGRSAIGKKGVVKEPSVHRAVIRNVLEYAQAVGFDIRKLTFSPIRGPEGNIEYLVLLEKGVKEEEGHLPAMSILAEEIGAVVAAAHASL